MVRGSEHVFRTGRHVLAVRAQFWFLKTQQQQPHMQDKNECFCASLFEFTVVTKGCFYHYQHLSVRVTPGSLVSKLCVCASVCASVCA